MIEELKEKFDYKSFIAQSRPLLTQDFVFKETDYEPLQNWGIVHQELILLKEKITSVRDIYLSNRNKRGEQLQIRLHLCWNGFKDAVDALFQYVLNFQRQLDIDMIFNTSIHEIGDIGFYWNWVEGEYPEVLNFVRNNVFVALTAVTTFDLIPLAKEIDNKLLALETTEVYTDIQNDFFNSIRKVRGDKPAVQVRGRLDIGSVPDDYESSFFSTSTGSMNRDPFNNDAWYYRASNETGEQEIVHYGLRKGILLSIDRLKIEIIKDGEKTK